MPLNEAETRAKLIDPDDGGWQSHAGDGRRVQGKVSAAPGAAGS
jgi:hypothetical protein